MTKEEYMKYTGDYNLSYKGFNFPDFTWEEITSFLNNLGYKILKYEGIASFTEKISHPAGSVENGKIYDDNATTVIAIKQNVEVTGRVDSEDVRQHNVKRVF